MLLAQNHSNNGIEKDPLASDKSPNYGINDSINGDKSIYDASQKVGGHEVLNASKNEQTQIVPYEVHLKVCARIHFNAHIYMNWKLSISLNFILNGFCCCFHFGDASLSNTAVCHYANAMRSKTNLNCVSKFLNMSRIDADFFVFSNFAPVYWTFRNVLFWILP